MLRAISEPLLTRLSAVDSEKGVRGFVARPPRPKEARGHVFESVKVIGKGLFQPFVAGFIRASAEAQGDCGVGRRPF